MFRPYRKLIAVLLAVWLPLFSGNALAVSVAMQQGEHHAHQAAISQQHMQHASHDGTSLHHMPPSCHEQQDNHQQQGSSCENCGVCHLACTGYLAGAIGKVADAKTSSTTFAPVTTLFHSVSSIPLVPPPLVSA